MVRFFHVFSRGFRAIGGNGISSLAYLAMDVDDAQQQPPPATPTIASKKKKEIQDVLILHGHKSEVFCLDWAAKGGLLVSG